MSCVEHWVNCGNAKVTNLSPCQSAAKLSVHREKVQRLPEGSSPLNNRLERPALAASLRGDEIVQATVKAVDAKRQNIKCEATIFALPDGGQALNFLTNQGNRNMLSLRDNLNAPDAAQKCVMFMFDGLFSRDVQ